ncbi:PREDICTED: COMM domain-containing protein 10, partial [Eurypyga helias]|uniref:COMM domain-containing protein 10 n=1 Tax=Eurypyga helias TaxID=54383 RepID=UPI0005292F68
VKTTSLDAAVIAEGFLSCVALIPSLSESSFSEEEEEKLQIAFSLEKQDLHLVLEAISFILEQAVYHNLKPPSLQQQLQSIHLDEDKAEAFASAWAAAGQDTIEKFRQRVLNPQKSPRSLLFSRLNKPNSKSIFVASSRFDPSSRYPPGVGGPRGGRRPA